MLPLLEPMYTQCYVKLEWCYTDSRYELFSHILGTIQTESGIYEPTLQFAQMS